MPFTRYAAAMRPARRELGGNVGGAFRLVSRDGRPYEPFKHPTAPYYGRAIGVFALRGTGLLGNSNCISSPGRPRRRRQRGASTLSYGAGRVLLTLAAW